jgi:hypothetical protein
LDPAQDGELQSIELKQMPELHVQFNAFSTIALPRWRRKVDLSYPFFYRKSQAVNSVNSVGSNRWVVVQVEVY